jgi:hypothetical protein
MNCWNFDMFPGWMMSIVVNAIASAARFRDQSGYRGIDYGLEVEIAVLAITGRVLGILGFGSHPERHGEIAPPGTVFPRYAIGPDQTVLDAFRPFYDDYFANVGISGASEALRELKPA